MKNIMIRKNDETDEMVDCEMIYFVNKKEEKEISIK